MPGIDTDLEALPARLGALLAAATDKLEAQAQGANSAPETVARGVGVIARSGAALLALAERLGRRRARGAGEDATEEADMDDAEDAGREGPDLHDERLERRLRLLAGNLRLSGGVDGELPGAPGGGAALAVGELGGAGAAAPAPA